MEGYGSYALCVNITKQAGGFYEDTVLVAFKCEKRVLEDDIVHLIGTVTGRTSYNMVLGATVTLPQIDAAVVDVQP